MGIFDRIGLSGAAAILDADPKTDDLGIRTLGQFLNARCRSFRQLHHLRTRTLCLGGRRSRGHVSHVECPRANSITPPNAHHILRTRRASSDMRSGVHAGSQTRLTLTTPTPGTLATAFSTICGNSPAAGQFGVVSVITRSTERSSLSSTL